MIRVRRSVPQCLASAVVSALLLLGAPGASAQAEDPPEGAGGEAGSAPAEPPAGVEEIVILGEVPVGPSLKDTESVILFDSADIQALGAQDVSDLSAYTPNVAIPAVGSTSPTFFIRGIGLSDYNANSTGAVSIYRDGVSINAPAIQLGLLYDVEQVQILRGPQGTGPFRNASGGAINVLSKKPTGEHSADLTSSFGRFDERDFQGHVEAPIVEDLLAGRLAFRFRERAGYLENGCAFEPPGGRPIKTSDSVAARRSASVCGERMDEQWVRTGQVSRLPFGLATPLNDTGTWGARGQFLLTPETELFDSQFLLNVHGSHVDELSTLGTTYGTQGNFLGGQTSRGYQEPEIAALLAADGPLRALLVAENPGLSSREITALLQQTVAKELANKLDPDPYRIDVNRTGDTLLDNAGGFLEMKFSRGNLQLTSRTGYEWYDRLRDIDQDYTPIVLFETESQDDAYQVTQDLNLNGDLLGGDLVWNLGGFFLHEELDAHILNYTAEQQVVRSGGSLPTVRNFSEKTQDVAVYGDLAWRLSDDWSIQGGARFNQEKKDFDYALFTENSPPLGRAPAEVWRAPTGMAGITYHFDDRSTLSFKYTRSWKAGHHNASANRLLGATTATPETIDAFETGLKLKLFDDRLTLDAALFFYKYRDYQILVVEHDFGSLPSLEFINASGAKVVGAEALLDLYPLKDLDPIPSYFDALHLYLTFGWLNGRFTEFADSTVQSLPISQTQVVNVLVVADYTGNRLPNAPPFTVAISADWPFEIGRFGTVTPRYDGAWSDTVYFDQTEGRGFGDRSGNIFLPKNAIGQPPHWLHNVRLAYQTPDGQFELAGWVRNLLDDTYKIYAFDASGFNNLVVNILNEPRTYGVDFTVRW